MLKPRLAVGFHFFNDFDTAPEMDAEIRRHYRGRLALARDFMVFNVTREAIGVRMAATSGHVWPNKRNHEAWRAAARGPRLAMSPWLSDAQLFPKR